MDRMNGRVGKFYNVMKTGWRERHKILKTKNMHNWHEYCLDRVGLVF